MADKGETRRGVMARAGDAAPGAGAATPGGKATHPLSPAAMRAVADQIAATFPHPFDRQRLVLLDVDPSRLHAYWAVASDAVAEARRHMGVGGAAARLVLRVRDLDGGEAAFDEPVQGMRGGTYVDVWGDARRYRAELGLATPGGQFTSLLSSNDATLPPPGPTAAPINGRAATWMDVTTGRSVDAPRIPPSVAAESRASEPRTSPPAAPGTPPSPLVEPFPPPPAQGTAPPDAAAAALEEHGAPSLEGTGGAESGHEGGSGTEARGGDAGSGASQPDQSTLTLSSHALGREGVDLEVNAELHVFGRTKPGRKLTLFGRPVAVRPDGTFSIRRPLPHGALVVSALLESGWTGDGEE